MSLRNLLDDEFDVSKLKKITQDGIFTKPVIGISRDGIINHNRKDYVRTPDEFEPISKAAEAVALMRKKGYRIVIFSNQPGISEGKMSQADVDMIHQKMLDTFGEAGCSSIDSIYYSTTKLKEDIYAMPNIGMMQRAERETGVKFKEGWFVGDKMEDLKTGEKLKSKIVLIKTGSYEETLQKLNTWANRDLKNKVKIFENLLEFAESLD